jgi:hypothetical protein
MLKSSVIMVEVASPLRISHYVWYFHRDRYFFSIEDAQVDRPWGWNLRTKHRREVNQDTLLKKISLW